MKKVLLVVVSICLCLAVFGTAALGGTAAAEKTEEELLQAAEDACKAKDYAKIVWEQADNIREFEHILSKCLFGKPDR